MKQSLQVLETGAEKLARLITAETGVSVKFDPHCKCPRANVIRKSITLPAIPDKLTEIETIKLRGNLDHEVAHVLFTKDMQGVVGQKTPGLLGTLENLVEDGRINRLMSDRYPGSRKNIRGMYRQAEIEAVSIMQAVTDPAEKEAAERMAAGFIAIYRHVTRDDELADMIAVGHQLYQTIPQALIDELEAVENYEDVASAAVGVRDWLYDPQPEPEPQEGEGESDEGDSDDSDGSGDSGKSDGADGDGEADGEGGNKKSDDNNEGDESDSSGSGDSEGDDDEEGDGSDGSSGDDDGEDDNTDSGDDSDGDSDDGESAQGASDGKDDSQGEENGQSDPSDTTEANNDPNAEQQKGERSNEDKQDDFRGYEADNVAGESPFTPNEIEEAFDAVAELFETERDDANTFDFDSSDGRWSSDTSSDLELHVRDYARKLGYSFTDFAHNLSNELFGSLTSRVANLRTRLIMDLQSKGLMMTRDHKAGRTLDGPRLARLRVSDPRVFKNRVKREKVNTAVTLLVDSSGSMEGNRWCSAIQLAALFCEALELANVPCEVLTFTTKYPNQPLTHGQRAFALRHTILKSFTERAITHRNLWPGMIQFSLDNCDGESVLWAAKRLAARSEKRKVLFVLSDGRPATGMRLGGGRVFQILDNHLREVVGNIEKAGIEVLGVGIQSDAVRRFYPKWVVYNNLDDLMKGFYSAVCDLLRQVTRKAA